MGIPVIKVSLVERAAKEAGREEASPDEVRVILGLKSNNFLKRKTTLFYRKEWFSGAATQI